jgi:hypothetical protein
MSQLRPTTQGKTGNYTRSDIITAKTRPTAPIDDLQLAIGHSVLHRMFDVIDDQHVERGTRRCELQSELLRKRGEQ